MWPKPPGIGRLPRKRPATIAQDARDRAGATPESCPPRALDSVRTRAGYTAPMTKLWLSAVITVLLSACGASSTSSGASTTLPSPSPVFARYKAQDAINAWATAGLSVTGVMSCPPAADSPIPKTFDEVICFTIPSIAPHGGQLMSFSTENNEKAMSAYFAQFPALAPYVYVHANVLAQMNSNLPAADAAKYDAAMAAALK